jgi:hypothetical protein
MRRFSVTGIHATVRSIASAINKILATVPAPGRWRKGIHNRRTAVDTEKVAHPMDMPSFNERPWAKTLHGVFPRWLTINKPSPIPKTTNPQVSINNRKGESCHLLSASQGVAGMV